MFLILRQIFKNRYASFLPKFTDNHINSDLEIYIIEEDKVKMNITADVFATLQERHLALNIYPSDSVDRYKIYDYSYIFYNPTLNMFLSNDFEYTSEIYLHKYT